MGFHHVAVATRDLPATHRFYTEVMGFELVKVVVGPTEHEGGWAKHVFYDTGGDGLIAFWDLHDDEIPPFDAALSTGHGLPVWVNHVAFTAVDAADLDHRKQRWLDAGLPVMEIDHGFCRSMYTTDPNGTLVEWCLDTKVLDAADRAEALALLTSQQPPVEALPTPRFHQPATVG